MADLCEGASGRLTQRDLVSAVTQLFKGTLHVVIGTKSLLRERMGYMHANS